MRGKRNHKLRTYDFLKSKPVLECQNWCLNLEGTLLLYNRGKCEKSAFKTMKKPSQCHEKHWTSKLWHMGQDLLHSSSVAHVQIRGIFLMQMAIGTCIHHWWFIRNNLGNNNLFTVFGLDFTMRLLFETRRATFETRFGINVRLAITFLLLELRKL